MKKYNNYLLKLSLLAFFSLFLLSSFTIYIESVNARPINRNAEYLYKIALKTTSDKFYIKDKVDFLKWENKFNGKIKNTEDAHNYIKKFLENLDDPYTRFLSEEEYNDEKEIMNSKLVGIGVKLAFDKPLIINVIPNSPADKAGVKSDDYILNIDGKNTKGLKSIEVCKLLKGEKGSKLNIKLKRGEDVLNKLIERNQLIVNAVTGIKLENDIALIKIDTFIPENTGKLFREEIIRLMPEGGLIIDLRNNSGGLLNNSIEVANLLLKEGKIVSTVSRQEKLNEYANSNQIYTGRIIILVNNYTASASEILTGALKDNKRAIVIGTKTFGKGLVQEIVELPDNSALHVTVATYLTPSGKDINKKGIIPDIVVTNQNKQLEIAKNILIASNKPENISTQLATNINSSKLKSKVNLVGNKRERRA